ncbi:hypothetical protein Lalb_Chr07g0182031 [Lupinus albus]|uniref:Uncharacterized protein n=1 Tax=Lupinus albus TaxID=3870 RepID=A0A6A4Q8U2_LUPAL|nr:hypothetical protein Lalb_Chr07g0182031 [Lupinus albus]
MKEIQPPQKMYSSSTEKQRSRRLKHIPNSDLSAKKRLSAAFSSVSEDSSNFSPISKISDANHNEDVTSKTHTNSNEVLIQILSLEEASTENLLPSDTLSSKKITDESRTSSVLTDCYGDFKLESALFSYVDAEVAENSPTKVQPKVHDWIIADPRYRKLMDEITKHVMEEICGSMKPEDSDRIDQLLHAKKRTMFLCLCIWIIAVLAVFFFTSDIHCPLNREVPT